MGSLDPERSLMDEQNTENLEQNLTSKKTLPLLVTRELVVFPGNRCSVSAGRDFSKEAAKKALGDFDSLIFVATQKESDSDEISSDAIYEVGTLCRILSLEEGENTLYLTILGLARITFSAVRKVTDYFEADGEEIPEVLLGAEEEAQLTSHFLSRASRDNDALSVINTAGRRRNLKQSISNLLDLLPNPLHLTVEEKISLLREADPRVRLAFFDKVFDARENNRKIDEEIDSQIRKQAEQAQKEYYLREKMKAIRQELGEDSDTPSDIDAIQKRLQSEPFPEAVKTKVKKELSRYKMMPDNSLEASLILNYIDTLMRVPWYQETTDQEDIAHVRDILDEDHYGLEKVKKRIIEYLAVKNKTKSLKAPILCFYGPPGCGKTSLGRSIARALGRKFCKASLGGVSDEAEIRGHRRTYVGSMPGRIIQGMIRAGTKNPVFLLDEIDKVGNANYKGDCASALLEVLDPEQNFAFNDNYLEEPYDLSHVLFIATANYLENVPEPLRDRLELIEVPSYTEPEKIKIATLFLAKKQCEANGLSPSEIVFEDDAFPEIIEFYTREAGVRELERLIASICRKAVVELLEKKSEAPIHVNKEKVREYLGVEIFEDSKKEKEPQVGVITGLAYTQYGGDILPIEVNYSKGKGELVITGKLGDVMKESCSIALDYVRANAEHFGINPDMFGQIDIHIHVPEGAVPKDGPSAGVAITCAIISCLSHTPADNNVAMTGEVTLRGNALPIGGLREKSLAALRSGIRTIIVPEGNKKDVSELPEEVKKGMEIIYMKSVDDAVKRALLH